MYLYLFNKIKIKPYVLLVVIVVDEKEYSFILDNITNIADILLNDEVIDKTDLLIISLIKEYTKKDYSYLLHEAKKNNCHLITTEKDYVRINSNYKKKFHYTIINTIFNKKKLIYNSFKKLHS